ncbi:hypothetical protein OZX67_02160 [Bifidobacterium sp. ESL0728]|uniref:type IV secretory system conjugative DNA transfer family protein n=1 Tax=Bifidobacterium sp. ESL0728 TaxID=2983220 RepID=UPI0023F8C126|nr:hypothetical protein [Bifidobacterium sp. ESL0728]WEV59389.1 hypothetical protein OZX67_02160 [Bifidobacterium sp. ESL0728]
MMDSSDSKILTEIPDDKGGSKVSPLEAETSGCRRLLRVSALKHQHDVEKTARVVTRRLIDVVNMSDYLTVIRVASMQGHIGVDIEVRISGDAVDEESQLSRAGSMGSAVSKDCVDSADAWQRDMNYVFGDIFVFDDPTECFASPTPIRDGYEALLPPGDIGVNRGARRSENSSPNLLTTDELILKNMEKDLRHNPQGFTNGTASPIDAYHYIDPTALFKTLGENDGSSIIYCLHKAGQNDQTMAQELFDTHDVMSRLVIIPNTPPLGVRVFITAPDRVSKSMLSEYKSLTGANFLHLDARGLKDATSPSAASIKGYAMPAAAASAFLRLPIAGEHPFKGMLTAAQDHRVHPLDSLPVPASTKPISLGTALDGTGETVDVTVKPEDLTEHMHVIGAPGSGKTTFLVDLACELSRQGVGFVFLSTHPDLMERIVADARPAKGFHVFGIDHADRDYIVPINPLNGKDDEDVFALKVGEITAALKEYMDPHSEGMFGERAASAFALVAQAYRRLGHISIPMVTSTLVRQDMCKRLAYKLRHNDIEMALHIQQELSGLTGPDATDLFSWLGSRFTILNSSPLLLNILGSGMNTIEFTALMDEGDKGLAVNLAGNELGASSAQFLLACWLIEIKSAMFKRKRPDKPFVVVVDEAHAAAFGPLASMLDEARKFGICLVVAHQRMGQLNPHLADALESDAGSFIALRTGMGDASRASEQLGRWPQEELMRLPHFEAAAVLSRGGTPTVPFTLNIAPPLELTDERSYHTLSVMRRSRFRYSLQSDALDVATPDTVRKILDSIKIPEPEE